MEDEITIPLRLLKQCSGLIANQKFDQQVYDEIQMLLLDQTRPSLAEVGRLV